MPMRCQILFLQRSEGIKPEAGPLYRFSGIEVGAKLKKSPADLFRAGRHLGCGTDGHIIKALYHFINSHAANKPGYALKVAGAAALEVKSVNNSCFLINIEHVHLGADTLRHKNKLHGILPWQKGISYEKLLHLARRSTHIAFPEVDEQQF